MNKKIVQMEDFLNQYCMEYAKYTITDRAIVDLRDGCKPIHRRLIYSMYLDKLTHDKNRTKSAKACSSVMRLSPHGDTSVYGAAVRLANDSVNLNLIDGKGSFSSINMRDVQPGASRYTEMRLAKVTKELLNGINKNSVDFKDNYDNSMKEPCVLPVSFPLVLANANKGVAVGVASTICGYNMQELCENTARVMLKEESFVMYPDFSTYGFIIKDDKIAEQIHNTGRGSFRLRGKYHFKDNNIIFTEIPYTTTVEQIEEKVLDLIKLGKLKEVTDVNNFTGGDGLNLTIEVKKNADKQSVVDKLFTMTTLQDAFNCNFTVLHNDKPQVLGVKQILKHWCEFRLSTVKRIFTYDKEQISKELLFLRGLEKILIDIDKCIDIIKKSKTDEGIIKNLQEVFDLTLDQAEYISNMKLRNISKNNIDKQLKKIKDLEDKIKYIDILLTDESQLRELLATQLRELGREYHYDRKTPIIDVEEDKIKVEELLIDDYNCVCYLTESGYFKKVKSISNKGNNKLKDGDSIKTVLECNNKDELLVFGSDLCCYKFKLHTLQEDKLSNLGQYLPNVIGCGVLGMSILNEENKYICVIYKNNKLAKVDISSFATKQMRSKLANSLSNSEVFDILTFKDNDVKLKLTVTDDREKVIDLKDITTKSTRNTQGIRVINWKNVNIKNIKVL